MTRSVLLVSTATRWFGTARMPRVLARAGFDVALLAPRGSLAAKSRYVSRIAQLPTPATPLQWLLLLVQTIDKVSPELLVQAYIKGPCRSRALVALRGEPLASFGWERHVATNPVKGQTTVLRFVRSPETRAFSEALCRGFGIGGFFNVQFVIDERTGAAYMLEINRRVVTHMHLGERVGRDLGRALLRALEGKSPEAPPAIDEDAGGRS